jgi:hypothetical protein
MINLKIYLIKYNSKINDILLFFIIFYYFLLLFIIFYCFLLFFIIFYIVLLLYII